MLVGNMMKNLKDNLNKLNTLNEKLSTGKQFQYPSEAPIKVANSMQYRSLIDNNEQYQRNVEQAANWLDTTESSLNDAGEVLQRARELAVYGSNGTLSKSDKGDIAAEIEQLKDELINIANNKLGDRFLFAGQATATKPFAEDGSYCGDFNNIEREINPGIKIIINYNGEETFSQAINEVDNLYDKLINSEAEEISDSIANIDDAMLSNITLRAEIGAKQNRLELTTSRLVDESLNLTKLLSQNEDVDIAEVITDLKMQETVYRASLATNARVMQPTLIDFLR
jgi:flagellar hook-associated protein 3 FlgL